MMQQTLQNSKPRLSSPLSVLCGLVMATSLISGCSGLAGAALNTLSGGGPKLEAQVGRENTKQIVASQQDASVNVGQNSRVSITETDTRDTVSGETVVVNNTPPYIIALLVVGSVLFGSMVDDVIRMLWVKFLGRKND